MKGKLFKPDRTVWRTKTAKTECAYHPDEKAVTEVTFTQEAASKVLGYVTLFPNSEFLVYLLGDPQTRTVTDVYLPKQNAGPGHVWVEEEVTDNVNGVPLVGSLHKHPGNGEPAFSGIDTAHLTGNHDVNIVIPQDGGITNWHVEVRTRYPCRCANVKDGTVKFPFALLADGADRLKQGKVAFGLREFKGFSVGDETPYTCSVCGRDFISYKAKMQHEDATGHMTTIDTA